MHIRTHLAVLAGALVAATALIPAHAELPEKSKVTICHATGNPGHWVKQNVAVDAILRKNGHAYHQGGRDIIPPFNPVGDLPDFPGLNWDDAGKAIWRNGCVAPAVPTPTPSESPDPTPTPDPTPSPTVTAEPTPAPTPTVTVTASPDPQPTVTATEPAPTVTATETVPGPTVTETPTPAPTVTATETVPNPAPTVTVTASPEPQPAVTVTSSPTFTPTASSTSTTTDPWADFDSDEILADVVREAESAYPWHEGNRHPSDVAPQQTPVAAKPGLPKAGW